MSDTFQSPRLAAGLERVLVLPGLDPNIRSRRNRQGWMIGREDDLRNVEQALDVPGRLRTLAKRNRLAVDPDGLRKLISYIEEAELLDSWSLDEALYDTKGCNLRLMPSLNELSCISTNENNLIIVAAVDQVLHFRIFDDAGKIVVDTNENRLKNRVQQITELREQLESLWPRHNNLTGNEKNGVITAVRLIIGNIYRKKIDKRFKRWLSGDVRTTDEAALESLARTVKKEFLRELDGKHPTIRLDSSLDEITKALQGGSRVPRATREARTVICHGWPGVGKSTLAAAVAHDLARHQNRSRAFPHGILWVALGSSPKVDSELALWRNRVAEAFGEQTPGGGPSANDVEFLRNALRDRHVLIVIDDAWSVADARKLMVGGPSCATLITTRRQDIAVELLGQNGVMHFLDVLSPDSALELLEARLENVLKDQLEDAEIEKPANQKAFRDLVGMEKLETVGLSDGDVGSADRLPSLERLPMAIEVAATWLALKRRVPYEFPEAINMLRRKIREILDQTPPENAMKFMKDCPPTVYALLQLSADALDSVDRDRFKRFGAVQPPKPAIFDLMLLSRIWKVPSVDDAKALLSPLLNGGLIQAIHGKHTQDKLYWMHAMVAELAIKLYQEEMPQAGQKAIQIGKAT